MSKGEVAITYKSDCVAECALGTVDRRIINYIISEKTNIEIAQELSFSEGNIKKRLGFLFKMYNVKSKVGLVREIFRRTPYILGKCWV